MDARPHDASDPPDEPTDGSASEPGDGTADGPDVDRRWAEIVAQLGDLGADGADPAPPRRPDDPERPGRHAGADPWARTAGPAGPPRDAEPPPAAAEATADAGPVGPRAWAPDPAVEEAEDHFEPPDPGPVLGGDPLITMAWSAVVGVPALLLVVVLAWRDMPTIVLQVAGVAFVLGLTLLLWRMPRGDDHDDGPGAVV